MPVVQVAVCETADDVRRLARETAARRKAGYMPRPCTVLRTVPAPEPPKDPEPAVISIGPASKTDDEIIAEINLLSAELERRKIVRRPSLMEIKQAVADAYGLIMNDLEADRRDAAASQARQVSYLLCKMLTLHSLAKVGMVHSRDHTTVLHGLRKVGWLAVYLEWLNHTPADPPSAWAASAARLHPLPSITREYGMRLDRRLKASQ